MAVAYEPPDPDALPGLGGVAARAGITRATGRAVEDPAASGDALRRLAAEVSSQLDLPA